ncbi:MAG: hypothetical protein IT365_25020 [Candidatus Hydrogenedentes bacterium]|nr:hypothetical protein [Candidatus Hydrogenedentota bacterium]
MTKRDVCLLILMFGSFSLQDARAATLAYVSDMSGNAFALSQDTALQLVPVGSFFTPEPVTRGEVSAIALNAPRGLLYGFGICCISELDIATGRATQRDCPWFESFSGVPRVSSDGSLIVAQVRYVESMRPGSFKDGKVPEYGDQRGLALIEVESLLPKAFLKEGGSDGFFTPDDSAVLFQGGGGNVLRYTIATGTTDVVLARGEFAEGDFRAVAWNGLQPVCFVEKGDGPDRVTEQLRITGGEKASPFGRIAGVYTSSDADAFTFYNWQDQSLTVVSKDGSSRKHFDAGFLAHVPAGRIVRGDLQPSNEILLDGVRRNLDATWRGIQAVNVGLVVFLDDPGKRGPAHVQMLDTSTGEWSDLLAFGTGGAANIVAVN